MGKQCNYYRPGFLSTARIIYWFCPFTGVSKLMTYIKRCVQTCTSENFNQRTMFFFVTAACTQRRNIQCVLQKKRGLQQRAIFCNSNNRRDTNYVLEAINSRNVINSTFMSSTSCFRFSMPETSPIAPSLTPYSSISLIR